MPSQFFPINLEGKTITKQFDFPQMKMLKRTVFIYLILPGLLSGAPPLRTLTIPNAPPREQPLERRGEKIRRRTHIYMVPPQPGYSPTRVLDTPEPPLVSSGAAGSVDIGKKTNQAFSEANAAAIHWLNLNDAQAYVGTYLEGGGALKNLLTEDQWAAAMIHTRHGLGPVHSRIVSSHRFMSSQPYGLRGNYMQIIYQTRFQRMANAYETITLVAESPLGLWRVIGYRINQH